eukprot:9608975-Karenia_brevis.AAC.1
MFRQGGLLEKTHIKLFIHQRRKGQGEEASQTWPKHQTKLERQDAQYQDEICKYNCTWTCREHVNVNARLHDELLVNAGEQRLDQIVATVQ